MRLTRSHVLAALGSLFLLACVYLLFWGRAGSSLHGSTAPDSLRSYDVAAPAMLAEQPASEAEPPTPAASPIPVAAPRISYAYGYSFRLASGRIAQAQEEHLALCRRLGPALCRVVSMRRGGMGEDAAAAQLRLEVAARSAEPFGRALVGLVEDGGGETVDRTITAEDLSRQMIDSDARIHTREVLIARLTSLLQTRSGNIAQAVEAERAINTAQEELEAARSSLADMAGRVAMSTVDIAYVARAVPLDAGNPVADAVRQAGSVAETSLAALVFLAGVALPWLVIGGPAFLALRTLRRRRALAMAE